MTVTKGKKIYTFPCSSGNNSDTESLHLTSVNNSDAESLQNEPNVVTKPFVPRSSKIQKFDELSTLKRWTGQRKLRRHQNKCSLYTLDEEDEDDANLIQSQKTPLTRLLEDEDALEFWNIFINKSEDEQTEIIEKFTSNNKKLNKIGIKEKPFLRISPKIRRTIKIRKNLPLEYVKKSENELIDFFTKTPKNIYHQFPTTYFERLLLHAVAQYHGLQSLNIIEGGVKKIEIFNSSENWLPAESFLVDFVAQLRK